MDAEGRWKAAVEISPLAVLVRSQVEWMLGDETIVELFVRHAPPGATERKLAIEAVVESLLSVVLGVRPSVHAAWQADRASPAPRLGASHQALYGRIGRAEPEFSCALTRASAERAASLPRSEDPEWAIWSGWRVRIVDGTMPGGSEHRLGPLRSIRAAGLPAKLVALFDPATGICVDAAASEDAYASETAICRPLFERAAPGEVYVADRRYCMSPLMSLLSSRGARFVIREHPPQLKVVAEGDLRSPCRGVVEQSLVVEVATTGERLTLRRVTALLDEPTEEGESEIRLLTDLPDDVPASRIARLYRRRWRIEEHFRKIKSVLRGELESLGQPRAAILTLCLALVAGNALAGVEGAWRKAHDESFRETCSAYYVVDEFRHHDRTLRILVPAELWRTLAALAPEAFFAESVRLAERCAPAAYRRHPRGPKRPRPRRASGKRRHHYATHRLLQEAKRRAQPPRPRKRR